MKPYLLSLGAGLLVGIVYSLLGVRSPAPPIIALVGIRGSWRRWFDCRSTWLTKYEDLPFDR